MTEPLFAFEGSSRVTVKRCHIIQEFDKLKKLFPLSLVNEVPETFEVPEGYLEPEFWKQLSEKLEGWCGNWQKLRLRIRRDMEKLPKIKHKNDQALNLITILIERYEVILGVCWNGDRATSPLPLEIFQKMWDELKGINYEACQISENIGYPVLFTPFSWSKSNKDGSPAVFHSSQTIQYNSEEKYETLKKQLESLYDDGPLHAYIAKHILSLCSYIYKIAKDVDVEEQEDTLPILIGLLIKYRKSLDPASYIEIKEAIENLDEECSNIRVSGVEYVYEYLPGTLEELRAVVATEKTRKETVRRSMREKKPIKLEVDEEDVRTVKKTKTREEMDEKKGRGRPKREAKPVKIYTPPHDSNGEEDDLVEDIVLLQSPRNGKRKPSWEKHPKEPTKKMKKNEEVGPTIPADKVTEKDIMIMNERIFLETTRLHLLLLKYPDGRPARSFIPAILESVGRALAALNELAMVDYVMHKSAVEVGVCQLMKDLRAQDRRNSTSDVSLVNLSPDRIEQRRFSIKSETVTFGDEEYRELNLTQL